MATIFSWNINSTYIPPSTLVISDLIDLSHVESNASPIDIFINKNVDLNRLILDPNNIKNEIETLHRGRRIKNYAYNRLSSFITNVNNVSPVLGNLALLGHISAVESYFRELFRRLILIDELTQKACREKLVTYGATLTHKSNTLPDALLEGISFSGSSNITESLRDFIGIRGNLPNSVTSVLDQFSRICQLRHCIVHRFGKIGVSNAIKLDWHAHKGHVEKPIKIDYNSLQEVSQICLNVVKEVNNYVWQSVMMRQIADGNYNNYNKKRNIDWSWNWKNDRKKFKVYYDVFDSLIAPAAIRDMRQAYNDYKTKYLSI